MYLIKIIQNYLLNRKIQVKLESALSLPQNLQFGVPQGSKLSPLLFLLYVNDIPEHKSTKIFMFADDNSSSITECSNQKSEPTSQAYSSLDVAVEPHSQPSQKHPH